MLQLLDSICTTYHARQGVCRAHVIVRASPRRPHHHPYHIQWQSRTSTPRASLMASHPPPMATARQDLRSPHQYSPTPASLPPTSPRSPLPASISNPSIPLSRPSYQIIGPHTSQPSAVSSWASSIKTSSHDRLATSSRSTPRENIYTTTFYVPYMRMYCEMRRSLVLRAGSARMTSRRV